MAAISKLEIEIRKMIRRSRPDITTEEVRTWAKSNYDHLIAGFPPKRKRRYVDGCPTCKTRKKR